MSRRHCGHEKVTFLGIQETITQDRKLALYTCINCKTTLAVPVKKLRSIKKK